jgi:hypothetical protein
MIPTYSYTFVIISLFEEGLALYLNRLELPICEDDLYKV